MAVSFRECSEAYPDLAKNPSVQLPISGSGRLATAYNDPRRKAKGLPVNREPFAEFFHSF
jgi:hypothetical protein